MRSQFFSRSFPTLERFIEGITSSISLVKWGSSHNSIKVDKSIYLQLINLRFRQFKKGPLTNYSLKSKTFLRTRQVQIFNTMMITIFQKIEVQPKLIMSISQEFNLSLDPPAFQLLTSVDNVAPSIQPSNSIHVFVHETSM